MKNVFDLYHEKMVTAEYMADYIKPNWNCVTDIGLSLPKSILNAIAKRVLDEDLEGIKLHSMLDLEPLDIFETSVAEKINIVSWFSGSGLRKSVNSGAADVMPAYYRDIPSLHESYIRPDVFMATVSPMDKHGYFSLGLTSSASEVHIQNAKYIFLEENKHMPRAVSGPMIHISKVTNLCISEQALPEAKSIKPDDVSLAIGRLIASEVPDGATLQFGIGAVPEAVGVALKDKKDLGIHTELFSDGLLELIECGAATNERKEINRGKTVATLVFGTKKVYDYIDDNPAVLMQPVNYVNDPNIIAQHSNFISVNGALEVDFWGQVCAESIGTKHVSGTGGQVDYVRGAIQSTGGKSFIAFPSTAQQGELSRIKPMLSSGAIVTTGKNDVDYIVTEYGIAKMRGNTLSQRCRNLIGIAHPKFRDELVFQAKKIGII